MRLRPAVVALVLASALPASVSAVADPAQMRVGREPGRTRIVLDLSAPVDFQQLPGDGTKQFVFELDGVSLGAVPGQAEFRGTPIDAVRVASGNDGALRVAISVSREELRVEHFVLGPDGDRGHRAVIDVYDPPPPAATGTGRGVQAVPRAVAAPDVASAASGVAGKLPVRDALSRTQSAALEPVIADAAPENRDSADLLGFEPLPGAGNGGLDLRPRGYAEFSAAATWPEEFHWSKLRSRVEYGADGRLDNGIRFRAVLRAEADLAYVVEDDFYPAPVRSDQRAELSLREVYFDLPAGAWEFRFGRQHVVWGEMVGLFLADVVSAKDTREFYLQDFEAIRLPQWAVRAERYGDGSHLELLYVPYPTYDEAGKPGANFYPFPQLTGPVPERTPDRGTISNHGIGARLSKLVGGWDLSGFYYRSTDVMPSLYLTASGPELRHDRIEQYGGTFSKDLRGLVLKGEAVYTAGRSFLTTDPTANLGVRESDVIDYIVGLTLPLDDWSLDFQLYGSHRFDHDPGMLYDEDEFGATALVAYQFDERLEAQMLYLSGFNRSDRSLQAWLGWRFAPSWRLRTGVDWFSGDDIGFFGRYDDQDRVFVELKRWF